MSTESEIYKKRHRREKLARLQAEQIAENKSRELYLKGVELEESLKIISSTKREIETLHRVLGAFSETLDADEITGLLREFLAQRLTDFSATVYLDHVGDRAGAAYRLDDISSRRMDSVAGSGFETTWQLAASLDEPSRILTGAARESLAELGYPEPTLLVPLRSPVKLLGFLAVHCGHSVCDAQAIKYIQSLAKEAAVSLQNALLFGEVQRLSLTDPLTGVSNRRSFDHEAARIVKLAVRHHRPLSAAMLDIDSFKQVNDTYGHSVGDEVLSGIASVLVNTTRTSDVVGRYGGEEFCLLFPETDLKDAKQAAERIRTAIAAVEFRAGGEEFTVTVSIGTAEMADPDESLEHLLSRCDKALYIAKESGRNRVMAG